jgi:hypothetical protein
MPEGKPRSRDRHKDPAEDRHLKKKDVKTRVSHATFRALEKRVRDDGVSIAHFVLSLIEGTLEGRLQLQPPTSPGELKSIE